AGFLDAAGTDDDAALTALRDAGAGALHEASVATVTGIAFIANAGAPQTVGATVIVQDADGEPVTEPTPVRLAGTITGAGTDAVAYCWQQLSGPAVTWVEDTAAGAVVPGADGLPAFPAGAPGDCAPGGVDADHW